MEYHILFTGVGRRVELLQAFRQAALNLNIKLKIYGADLTGTAPALAYCDYTRKACGMRDENYIPQLLEICQNDNIDMLIPTIDTDLLVLAENAEKFDAIGTKVLISKPDKIAVCRDKNYTADFFEGCGLKAPRTVNDCKLYKGPFPCFIKPKDGSSSINAFRVNHESELAVYAEKVEDYIVQPFIEGVEYTVDIFCDYDGNPIYITPRVRTAVRGGEVLKTKIAMDDTIIEECKQLIAGFKLCGPMTVQLIKQNDTGINYYIEINPRFGGGAPLSMKAGARSAEAILCLLDKKDIAYQREGIDDGAVFSRFDQSVCIENKTAQQPIKGIIFDLDDTLYSEKEYVKSGYKSVAQLLEDEEATSKLWNYFLEEKSAIDELLIEKGQLERKQECIRAYREHMPKIHLYDGVEKMLQILRDKGIKVGIITDGRVQGQKNKIVALGLDKLIDDIIITDELGGEQFRKPNDIAFRIMQCRWRIPFEQMMYVGDNLNKDFQAPKQLGMRSVYLKNEDGLYFTDVECDSVITIKKVKELMQFLD